MFFFHSFLLFIFFFFFDRRLILFRFHVIISTRSLHVQLERERVGTTGAQHRQIHVCNSFFNKLLQSNHISERQVLRAAKAFNTLSTEVKEKYIYVIIF